ALVDGASGGAAGAALALCSKSAISRPPPGVIARMVASAAWRDRNAASACDGKSIHLGNGWADGGSCPHAQVNANEVLWIGDSWILVTGSQHTRVADLARASGAIGPNDDYVIGAAAASPLATIANQYAAREAGATKVKVIIMDGGTWDTILANGSDASVNGVVNTFGQFLTQV